MLHNDKQYDNVNIRQNCDKDQIVSKNEPCDVMKMMEMGRELGKKANKKEIDNPSF